MKPILAIDTSSAWCSVALSLDPSTEDTLVHHELLGPGASQHLLPWITDLLQQGGITLRDLDAIAVGIGPGAFTGVRLAVAAVQGLALASHLPVAPVASLDAIAATAIDHPLIQAIESGKHQFTVAIDARMGEMYWANYSVMKATQAGRNNTALPERIGDIQLSRPEDIQIGVSKCVFGSAVTQYPNFFERHMSSCQADGALGVSACGVLRCAKAMLAKGQLIAVDQLEPLYVRNKVALTSAERGAK
ncbi:MAG: tRNA (adenosine(37)-N6)-threonylcarbamoyltransferase complex dimerization subunit type 1 TsaB [Polynucleobacter sp.]|nr:tRNA (adenosine(37)-N6)-threonylcarbamoyltransferase complex dimerization subunit type 1 TsaB [Polynucleobacter sp.]